MISIAIRVIRSWYEGEAKETWSRNLEFIVKYDIILHLRICYIGIIFSNLQNLSDIQLPFALEPQKTMRKRDLTKYVKQIHDLYSTGSTSRTIAEVFGVTHTAVLRYLNAS